MKNKKALSIEDLRVGMACVADIKFNGRVLISEGVPLTEVMIEKLKSSYFYHKIEVYCDEDESDHISRLTNESIKHVTASLDKLADNLSTLFDDMTYLKTNGIEEIRQFALDIEKELYNTNSLVKCIILSGSETDSIYRHSVNVASISALLGKWLGMPNEQIKLLTYSALLHDFGKTKIPKEILNKPSSLTSDEFNLVKTHPVSAYNIIKEIRFLDKSVSYGILMHHERLDGSGYPLGLKSESIHQFAKIIAIADTFDAINSNRPYKLSSTPIDSLLIMQQESLHKLDYQYCKVFLEHLLNYYTGENVLLNTNEVCKIMQLNLNNLSNPLLLHDNELINLTSHNNLRIEKLL